MPSVLFAPRWRLLSLIALLLTAGAEAAAVDLELQADLRSQGQPAQGRYEIRVLVDRGLPGLKQIIDLGALKVADGRLVAPLTIDDAAFEQAHSFELQGRPAHSKAAFESLATVAAKGICALSPWLLTGNADATVQSYLGTSNDQPLRFRAQNAAVGSLDYRAQTVGPNTQESVNIVFGWPGNSIGDNAWGNVVLGGARRLSQAVPNVVANGASYSKISGGYANQALAAEATISGGNNNRAAASATVAGGTGNLANAARSSIGGGRNNATEGSAGAIAGGENNSVGAFWSAIPGGISNRAIGNFSLAAGAYADALHDGSFVWSQSDGSYRLSSSANDQVVFQARGGFGINGATGPVPGSALNAELTLRSSGIPDNNTDLMLLNHDSNSSNFRGFSLASVPNGQFYITSLYNNGGTLRYDALFALLATSSGNATIAFNRGSSTPQLGAVLQVGDGGNDGNGAYLTTGGTWTNASSRDYKAEFRSVDPERILDRLLSLPLSTWRYRQSDEGRHLGPTAEAFAQAFSLGNDPKHISTVDADGVNMAAIQGLNRRLERENKALTERLTRLEARLAQIESRTR